MLLVGLYWASRVRGEKRGRRSQGTDEGHHLTHQALNKIVLTKKTEMVFSVVRKREYWRNTFLKIIKKILFQSRVLLICLIVFLMHLDLELLTQFPASKEKK